MSNRFLVGVLMVTSLLMGCGSRVVTQPASAPTMNEDGQMPEQEQNPAATIPESTVGAATEDLDERAGSTPMLIPDIDQPASVVDIHCTETDPHPIAQSIAQTYRTSYEEVMTFFCTGVEFEDIVLAYQTAELAGRDVKDVLTLWYDFGNWEDVWQELGLE